MGYVTFRLGKYRQAVDHFVSILGEEERLLGSTLYTTLDAKILLARAYDRDNRSDDTIQLLNQPLQGSLPSEMQMI